LAPAGRAELPPRRAPQDVAGLLGDPARRTPEPVRREQPRMEGGPEGGRAEGRSEGVHRPPPSERNGSQATNFQR
ncbi:MAG: hypothetical protein ACXVYI_12490, partial [Mycobacterium sp.]